MNDAVFLDSQPDMQNGFHPHRHSDADIVPDLEFVEGKTRELLLLNKKRAFKSDSVCSNTSVSESVDFVESRRHPESFTEEDRLRSVSCMADAYQSILAMIGEDPERQGLHKTPERAAKALMYFTKGYEEKISGECSQSIFFGRNFHQSHAH